MRTFALERFFTIAALVLLLGGCGPSAVLEEDPPPKAGTASSSGSPALETDTVSGQPYVEKVDLPGASVHGFETTQLLAKLGGYVGEIKKAGDEEIDIGALVEKGDALALLDVPEMADELAEKQALLRQAISETAQAQAAIKQALAELEKRKAQVGQAEAGRQEKRALLNLRQAAYRRIARLVAQGAVGTENLDEAKFALDAAESSLVSVQANVTAAKAEVSVAEENVTKAKLDKQSAEARVHVAEAAAARIRTLTDYATIRAPYAGIITKRFVDHGAFVRPATSNSGAMPLFEITRIDKVRVVVSAPNVKTTRIRVGQKVRFHGIGGLPGVVVEGTVARSAIALDENSRMMRIEIHFKNPVVDAETDEQIVLKPGMFGTATVTLNSWSGDNLLPVVPASAVASTPSGHSYVIVLDDEARTHQRRIEMAFNDAVHVGISKGVKIGEVVVLKNTAELVDSGKFSLKSP